MIVRTNDPRHSHSILRLSGSVLPDFYISTNVVRLTGSVGQPIKKTVTITTTPQNPFKIKNITANKGVYIRYDIAAEKQTDGTRYRMTVYNTKPDKGWYTDKLFIKTDSNRTPEFQLKVLGFIRE